MKPTFLAGMSVRYKLSALFLALILVPFVVYTSITMYQSSRNADRLGRYSTRQVLLQAEQFVESRVGLIERSLHFISQDADVRRLSNLDPSTYESNLSQWISDAGRLRRVMLAIEQGYPDIAGITHYMVRGPAAFSESSELKALSGQGGMDWYLEALQPGRDLLWLPSRYFPSADSLLRFHGVVRIPDDLELGKTVGYIRVDVPARVLSDILDQASFSSSSSAFLINSAGEPIALSVRARGSDRRLLAVAHTSFAPAPTEGKAPRALDIGGRRYLADCLYVKGTDWRLILFVPYEDIDAFGEGVRKQMLVALAIILPLMLPLAFWVASTSTRRIARLVSGIREFERGNLAVKLPGESGDEIGELTGNLNRMASRIASLLEERYRLGQEMKHQEMKALQAQINPHFLYNTLDLVNCLSLKLNAPRIGAAVEALSRFYRLSLSGGAKTVTVRQELEHVETYVRIQNMRFDDGVRLAIQVPEEIQVFSMLKMVLQPLVENSILHGIREKESGRGTITIRGSFDGLQGSDAGRLMVIEIEDDGVGMSPAQVEEMLRERSDDGHGYGVWNIDRRLKVEYGDQYGLSYRSQLGRGTTVTVRIPVVI